MYLGAVFISNDGILKHSQKRYGTQCKSRVLFMNFTVLSFNKFNDGQISLTSVALVSAPKITPSYNKISNKN